MTGGFDLPSQPNSHKGTLVLLAPNAKDANFGGGNSYFVFQYNPEKLLHTFNPPTVSAANTTVNPQIQLQEYFNITFELDSTDLDPQDQNQTATDLGIHPSLAMLELMMQPQNAGNQKLAPIVVFNWGTKRSVAVHVVSMSVEEQEFDMGLHPVRATANLTLRVLDASEVGNNTGARTVCTGHQSTRATLADAYKIQTGQGGVGGVTGASAAASATSGSAAALGAAAGVSTSTTFLKAASVKVTKTSQTTAKAKTL